MVGAVFQSPSKNLCIILFLILLWSVDFKDCRDCTVIFVMFDDRFGLIFLLPITDDPELFDWWCVNETIARGCLRKKWEVKTITICWNLGKDLKSTDCMIQDPTMQILLIEQN